MKPPIGLKGVYWGIAGSAGAAGLVSFLLIRGWIGPPFAFLVLASMALAAILNGIGYWWYPESMVKREHIVPWARGWRDPAGFHVRMRSSALVLLLVGTLMFLGSLVLFVMSLMR